MRRRSTGGVVGCRDPEGRRRRVRLLLLLLLMVGLLLWFRWRGNVEWKRLETVAAAVR